MKKALFLMFLLLGNLINAQSEIVGGKGTYPLGRISVINNTAVPITIALTTKEVPTKTTDIYIEANKSSEPYMFFHPIDSLIFKNLSMRLPQERINKLNEFIGSDITIEINGSNEHGFEWKITNNKSNEVMLQRFMPVYFQI